MRDGKAFLRFCTDPGTPNAVNICPNLGEASDYVLRNGENLDWYQEFGKKGHRLYLSLSPASDATPPGAADDGNSDDEQSCPDDQE